MKLLSRLELSFSSASALVSSLIYALFLLVVLVSSFVQVWSSNLDRSVNIRILGSSLLYSHINLVTEFFDALQKMKQYEAFINITTESTGSGGGIKIFCDQAKDRQSPIAVTSTRKIANKEKLRCKKNGYVIRGERLGSGAIVLVSINKRINNLGLKDIFHATSKYILKDGVWIKNDYQLWSEINPSLPSIPIKIIGPSFNSGAMHTFLEKVHGKYYSQLNTPVKYRGIREGSVYLQAGDSEAVVATKLEQRGSGGIKDSTIAIIDFGYYLMNKQKFNLLSVNGVKPDTAMIKSKTYPLIRNFYIYYKVNHEQSKYFEHFVDFMQSPQMREILQNYGIIL